MTHRRLAGVLALAGGALMVASGFENRGFLLTALGFVEGDVLPRIGGLAGETALLVVSVLVLLIALGGVTVALGGVAMFRGHLTVGRVLVMLGGGSGFLGLLASLAYFAFTSGLAAALRFAPYWLGLVLAVLSRRVAKETPGATG